MKLYDPDEAVEYIRVHIPAETAGKIADKEAYDDILDFLSCLYEKAGLTDFDLDSIDDEEPDFEAMALQASETYCKTKLEKSDFLAIIKAENDYEDSLLD